MTERASDDKLAEMLADCEGVTPGPWEADFLEILHVDRRVGGWRKMATVADDEAASDFPIATATHIANCDPDTIRSIITELQELRKAVADAHRIIEACLAVAQKGDPNDSPIPLVGSDAVLWHRARAEAFRHALEMMPAPSPETSHDRSRR